VAAKRIEELLSRLPAGWVEAASIVIEGAEGIAAAPPVEEAWSRIASSLGWRSGSLTFPLAKLSTKVVTWLQLESARDKLGKKHAVLVGEALGTPQPPEDAVKSLSATLKRLWKIKWENEYKEPFWRLCADGFAGFSMHRSQLSGPIIAKCPCGTSMTEGDRSHHFWECAVAQSLRMNLEGCLTCQLSRNHLWLVNPPDGVKGVVWDIVCLAAIAALERGRQYLYKHRNEGAAPDIVNLATVHVESSFWERLTSFATVGGNIKGWESVGEDHPFLCVDRNGRIRTVMPTN
jgi:hypothetical protein